MLIWLIAQEWGKLRSGDDGVTGMENPVPIISMRIVGPGCLRAKKEVCVTDESRVGGAVHVHDTMLWVSSQCFIKQVVSFQRSC